MLALWAVVPSWAKVALVAFLAGSIAGGMAAHSAHKMYSDGQKAMAARVLERLDRKVDEATALVEKSHLEAKQVTKIKERIVYREVAKRVPQNDPVGCPPIDADTIRLLNAARTAKSAEEFMRSSASLDADKATGSADTP